MKNTFVFCLVALSVSAPAELVTNILPVSASTKLYGPVKVEVRSEALTVLSRRGSVVSTNLSIVPDSNSPTRVSKILTVVTNEVDVPIQMISDPKKEWELAMESRKQLIEQERRLGIHKDIRDRWDLLRERGKGLKKGMTASEVVKYVGFEPVVIWIQERVSPEEIADKRVKFEDIDDKAIAFKMNYSPYEKEFPIFRRTGMPYDMLWLTFDDSGKLESWAWGF